MDVILSLSPPPGVPCPGGLPSCVQDCLRLRWHILAGQVRLWGASGVLLTNLGNEVIVLLWERISTRIWLFPSAEEKPPDRAWQHFGEKAAERKEKHSRGNNSGGVEGKPQQWQKLLWMVHRAVIQSWGKHPRVLSWREAQVSQAAHRAGL